jgi:DNA-binding beta-propeller fold protein YncE
MNKLCLTLALFTATAAVAQDGPYKILKTAKVGGAGGFDYVYADSDARRLYVARSGNPGGRITVFNLDTLEPAGELAETSGHGAVVNAKTHHGFASSKPITMFDSKTLAVIKKITVEGNPDGLLDDPFNDRVYVLSHAAPNVTVLDAKDGSILGTIDLGGAPEQGATDGKGHIYIDVEDKENIAVVDAKTMKVTAHYDISSKGGTCAGLALDVKRGILFAACRKPAMMVVLKASDGKILDALPIGAGTDGAAFNPKTMEAFSSQGDGTLTVIKEKNATSFAVEQTITTPQRAKTLALDTKTGNIFLIYAEFAPAPAPPPGGRAGRGSLVPDSFSIIMVGK